MNNHVYRALQETRKKRERKEMYMYMYAHPCSHENCWAKALLQACTVHVRILTSAELVVETVVEEAELWLDSTLVHCRDQHPVGGEGREGGKKGGREGGREG